MHKASGLLFLLLWAGVAQAGKATVAAAATLRYALEEIAPKFTQATGHTVNVAYGASGNFYSQIKQGAPFDVFLSADMAFAQKLVDEKLAEPPVHAYAEGRLVLLVPNNSELKADGSLKDLAASLNDGRLKRFAIANPSVAPYGMRAREALMHVGLWERIQPRLVVGENISQATQFASSGAAQAGLVALSLAMSAQLVSHTRFELVPKQWHRPLYQGMVLIRAKTPQHRLFMITLKRQKRVLC